MRKRNLSYQNTLKALAINSDKSDPKVIADSYYAYIGFNEFADYFQFSVKDNGPSIFKRLLKTKGKELYG